MILTKSITNLTTMTTMITGIVVYKNIGIVFWGIEGLKGEEWLPVNLPKMMEQEGKQVSLRVQELEGESVFMWGEFVEMVF